MFLVLTMRISGKSERFGGRVIKTNSRKLGVLSKLTEVILCLQVKEIKERNEDPSQIDPHSEVGTKISRYFHTVNLDLDNVP